jgi:hypothetical protein
MWELSGQSLSRSLKHVGTYYYLLLDGSLISVSNVFKPKHAIAVNYQNRNLMGLIPVAGNRIPFHDDEYDISSFDIIYSWYLSFWGDMAGWFVCRICGLAMKADYRRQAESVPWRPAIVMIGRSIKREPDALYYISFFRELFS